MLLESVPSQRKIQWEKKIWLLSSPPVLLKGNRPGTWLWLCKGREMSDRWGRGYLSTSSPGRRSPCTDCVVCTQFSDARICPQSTGMYVRKCKAAASITHANVQKVRSKWEWKTNPFILQLSFIISWAKLERWVSLGGERALSAPRIIKTKMTMQRIVLSGELQLQWVHFSSLK